MATGADEDLVAFVVPGRPPMIRRLIARLADRCCPAEALRLPRR
jgi:hypothetical protein